MIDELSQYLITPPRKTEGTSVRAHLPFFYWMIDNLKPLLYVELGVFRGDLFFGVCKAVQQFKTPTKCCAVDCWKGDPHAGFYNDSVYNDFVSFYEQSPYKYFASFIRSNFDDAVEKFDDNSIELLMIDGYHTYEAVTHDFNTWLPKMNKENGVVLFHDTVVRENNFGVWKFFEELQQQYPNKTFNFTHSFGLGVLMLGNALPNEVAALGKLSPEEVEATKRLFETAGDTVFNAQ